jgi:hypothetical protein
MIKSRLSSYEKIIVVVNDNYFENYLTLSEINGIMIVRTTESESILEMLT